MVKTRCPSLSRFLSDFTLGFSDGLTVPFALTAGLSSLGRADTVIYAGLAELCAGSISMGIGGYLSAADEIPSAPVRKRSLGGGGGGGLGEGDGDEEELRAMLHDESATSGSGSGSESPACDSLGHREKGLPSADEALVRRHLQPLDLPAPLVSDVVMALRRSPDGLAQAALQLQQRQDHEPPPPDPSAGPLPVWPVACGLSISLGYVVGGIVPLSPYFFAPTVGLGLGWSIGLCLVALMAFGSVKSWLLSGRQATWGRCLLQGFQMLVLGSLAAGAAVLCVNLVGGGGSSQSAG
ncbi:hypothetical protein CDD83_8124 [Cordyceps sp. RAO-2017]|nr:hypothetical protein CDD83_8124 [Cordyceps sp. RAO-2017]